MSTIRNPVGPESSGVYWRRRLVVGLIAVAVIVVVLLIVFRPGGDAPTPVPSGSPSDSSEVSPEEPGTDASAVPDGEIAACAPSSVRVVPVVDASIFANGEDPMFSMEVTNIGALPCSYDVGTGVQEYVVTSGTDRIWSSADCAQEPTENVMTLEPNQQLATTPFAWNRTRSTPETCDGPEVIAGGASYHLTVLLGESESDGSFQFILN